jgi:protein phosphatase 4 regulatory subunit 3
MSNLADVEQTMRLAINTAPGREALTKYIITNDYVAKLCSLVSIAEDFESLEDLHRLCSIMKSIILLNDNTIMETVVKDDLVQGVVGALECEFVWFSYDVLVLIST